MMLYHSKNIENQSKNYGAKANNLLKLKSNGFDIPDFTIIPADYLTSLLSHDVDINKSQIRNYKFNDTFIEEIFSNLGESSFVAVRSSALNEDGNQNSFAGQYETKLFVTKSTFNQALVAVWESAFSKRVESYQEYNNIHYLGIAIIVQRMINADVSGVAFSMNPLTGNINQTVINAVRGLGEGIVSGEINADLYIVENEKITPTLAEKKHIIQFDSQTGHGTCKLELSQIESEASSLNDQQVLEINLLIRKVTELFQCPQDIEFCFHNEKLYLLQARPITALSQKKDEYIIWDNSNIIESYPGLTLPLTFSFIEKMYEAVYRQLSQVLGIKLATIEKHSQTYSTMLGLLCGKVYYNLNNWHKTLSLLPGYSLNKEFMDNMMGVKEKFEIHVQHSSNTIESIFDLSIAVIKIIKQHSSLNKDRIAFQLYFNSIMKKYEAMDYKTMTLNELLENYQNFETTLVKKWKAPLVNDFFCMIYFGLLQKLVKKYKLDENGIVHNDLVTGSGDIISTEPAKMTQFIANMIKQSPLALTCFISSTPKEILSILHKAEFSEIDKAIKAYLIKWGDRCVGELKLETVTYKQRPENYIKILQNYVCREQDTIVRKESTIRKDAETKVSHVLKGHPLRKLIFSFILHKTRYLVSNRENLRFERTRGFGMVRTMMVEFGNKFTENNFIDDISDIFYLTQQEIFDTVKNMATPNDLKAIVHLRKLEYSRFENIHLPERIKASSQERDFSIFNTNAKTISSKKTLQGIGCCAGIVRGKVSIIQSPTEIDSLNNTILVTASTDPGWVVLFPSASAIVVERGSLLSHSAIVSREMGIPCIVGVKDILSVLKTGDIIEIDGTNGTVTIIEKYG